MVLTTIYKHDFYYEIFLSVGSNFNIITMIANCDGRYALDSVVNIES